MSHLKRGSLKNRDGHRSSSKTCRILGLEGVSDPLAHTLLPTSPIGGLLQFPWRGAHHCVSWNSSDGKKLCAELRSDRGSQGRLQGQGSPGLREGEPDQPCRPSLPPAPSLAWSYFQAAWSPVPAPQTTLTLSATPALVWSTSRLATQAAQAG